MLFENMDERYVTFQEVQFVVRSRAVLWQQCHLQLS
jgi:hypothetical protein